MKVLFWGGVFVFLVTGVYSQSSLPPLAEIKIAAEAGDAVAQDKLAQAFVMRTDTEQAEIWYRKSAEQGYAHAQGQLGHMLLLRSRMSVGLKSTDKMDMANEAVKWIILAANQGDKQGQADFADVCFEGKWVKQDLIEAYKWGELASRGSMIDVATISGRSTRDAAIFKMDTNQIEEARRRVAAFVPHQMSKNDLPDPSWVQKIKLSGISGTPDHRLALINNHTFGKGDQALIKIEGKTVMIDCVEISDAGVVISIDGLEGTRELRLP